MQSFIYLFVFLLSVFISVYPWILLFASLLCVSAPLWQSSCAEAREDRKRRLFCALAAFSQRPNARWAPFLARASGDQFACFCEQQIVCPVERFGKADDAGIEVIEIQVRLKKFFFSKGCDCFDARRFLP